MLYPYHSLGGKNPVQNIENITSSFTPSPLLPGRLPSKYLYLFSNSIQIICGLQVPSLSLSLRFLPTHCGGSHLAPTFSYAVMLMRVRHIFSFSLDDALQVCSLRIRFRKSPTFTFGDPFCLLYLFLAGSPKTHFEFLLRKLTTSCDYSPPRGPQRLLIRSLHTGNRLRTRQKPDIPFADTPKT